MLILKGCPKCHGDLLFEKDYYGWYESCIQCGLMLYLPPVKSEIRSGESGRLLVAEFSNR